MTSKRSYRAIASALGVVAFLHAALTWPGAATAAFFGGGMVVAFVAEATAIGLGWLEHHIGPKVLGVPLYLLLAWPGTVYILFRLVGLVTSGWLTVGGTAAVATAYDILTDHYGVAEGHWSYTDGIPGPRYRGVPWWNFVGWFVISAATAALALPFL